jgi:hypothetical protein
MAKKKPVKRLPKWFRPPDDAASDLIPELAAQKLFYQIALVVGVNEAAAIFRGTTKCAKEAAQSVKPQGRPPGSGYGIRVLTTWQLWQTKRPPGHKKTREGFAEWYVDQQFEPDATVEGVIRQLNRFLKPS